MSIDVLPETQSHPQPPRGQQRSGRRDSSPGRWWRRGLLAVGVVAVVASAAALIPSAGSSPQIGPDQLTHTITRGDLIVTLTEQGTLESSNNTEIKCKVRSPRRQHSWEPATGIPIIWVIESGTEVKPGDELLRLDTLSIEESIHERTKYALLVRSGAERSRADVARAELAIPEYLEGRYRSQLMTLEKDLAIAESNLRIARNRLNHVKKLFTRGYETELKVEERTFAVTQAELNVEVKTTEIDVLNEFTKAMELETLNGNFNAARARLEAEEERAKMDGIRLDQAVEELGYCVIRAERSGLVIYPTAEEWKNTPDIAEGVAVRKDQVLLLMPDLSKMQVKVGIHESIADRIKPGMAARVTLPDKTLSGKVISVASVARPAGRWSGNVVKYDTIIKLPSVPGLKPGMTAEVEVIIDRHEDVLRVPVAAVVETAWGDFCWVKTADGAKQRQLALGDTDDVFLVVQVGLKEGEEVVLDPLASIEEAQSEVFKPLDETKPREKDSPESGNESSRPANLETDHVD